MRCWVVKFFFVGVFLNALLAAITLVPLYVIKDYATPMARGFDPADAGIALSIKPNTVSSDAATWGSAFMAAGVIILVEVLLAVFRQRRCCQKSCNRDNNEGANENISLKPTGKSSSPGVNHWSADDDVRPVSTKHIWLNTLFVIWLLLIVLLTGDGITGTVTNMTKVFVARPRPSFMNFCRPDYTALSAPECTVCGNRFNPKGNWPVCPTCPFIDGDTAMQKVCADPANPAKRNDMWMSFPSGHASYSMFACVYLAAYLYTRMRESCLISRYLVTLQPFIIFAALVFGLYSSLTRVSDHRHHLSDILAGAMLGTIIGLVMFMTVAKPLLQRVNQRHLSYCNPGNCGDGTYRGDVETPTCKSEVTMGQQTNESF